MSRDLAPLADIAEASRCIAEFISGYDRTEFEADPKTRSAVMHPLLIIGEATKRLSAGLREQHRDVPWRAIAGMRDRLIHGYHAVDIGERWRTASADVPTLAEKVRTIMRELDPRRKR
jgi:uncharacterized protein with HEPN domain